MIFAFMFLLGVFAGIAATLYLTARLYKSPRDIALEILHRNDKEKVSK